MCGVCNESFSSNDVANVSINVRQTPVGPTQSPISGYRPAFPWSKVAVAWRSVGHLPSTSGPI